MTQVPGMRNPRDLLRFQISRRALAPGFATDSPEPGASARRLMNHAGYSIGSV